MKSGRKGPNINSGIIEATKYMSILFWKINDNYIINSQQKS